MAAKEARCVALRLALNEELFVMSEPEDVALALLVADGEGVELLFAKGKGLAPIVADAVPLSEAVDESERLALALGLAPTVTDAVPLSEAIEESERLALRLALVLKERLLVGVSDNVGVRDSEGVVLALA